MAASVHCESIHAPSSHAHALAQRLGGADAMAQLTARSYLSSVDHVTALGALCFASALDANNTVSRSPSLCATRASTRRASTTGAVSTAPLAYHTSDVAVIRTCLQQHRDAWSITSGSDNVPLLHFAVQSGRCVACLALIARGQPRCASASHRARRRLLWQDGEWQLLRPPQTTSTSMQRSTRTCVAASV
jgi:hypothetical protein